MKIVQRSYIKVVENIETAAKTCIPKAKTNSAHSHNIPMWRDKMSTFKEDVDYWIMRQTLDG